MIFSSKPYYGECSAGGFQIRACGARKRHSLKPLLSASLRTEGSRHTVVMTVTPHALLVSLAILFVGACAFYWALSVVHFFGTGNAAPVLSWMLNLAVVGACFVLPYHFAAQRTLAFWIKMLQLEPSPSG